ncbi:MAG: large subunit ribosomal protein L15 [Gammaproteobacteria bacterium]|jgi:large subunit ribosomal protein L15
MLKIKIMELHNLKPAAGSIKKGKRIARGQGSGHGGTSTRGHKGAKSRSGYKSKRNFEGGQMPLQMRLPKRGFKNPNRVESVPLNLNRLQAISDKHNLTTIDMETLVASGIVRKNDRVKILGRGELKAKLSINVHAISDAAKTAIEGAGGSVNLV